MTHFHLGPDALSLSIASQFQAAYRSDPATCDILADPPGPPDEKFPSPLKYPLTYPGISGIVGEDETGAPNDVHDECNTDVRFSSPT